MANYADCRGFMIRGIIRLLVAIVLPALPTRTSDGGSEVFAPGGTRLISISPSCQNLTIEDTSSMYPATLYLLLEKPQLTGHDEFQVDYAATPINNKKYEHVMFYLYSGSNFSMNCCLHYGIINQVDFYIIQGESNFESWEDSYNRKYTQHYTMINSFCTSSPDLGGQTTTFYNVTISEEYFFVFYNPSDLGITKLKSSMHFQRTLYNITSSEIVKRCEAGPTSESYISICCVEVPDNSSYSALIILGTPWDTTYTDTVRIDWHCAVHSQPHTRLQLNAAIVCIPLGVVVACLAAIVSVYLYWWFRRRKRRFQVLMAERIQSRSVSAPPYPLNGDHADSTLLDKCRYGTIHGRETSEERNISDATTPLQLLCQKVLDPAPMDRKPNMVSESATLSGAAALLANGM